MSDYEKLIEDNRTLEFRCADRSVCVKINKIAKEVNAKYDVREFSVSKNGEEWSFRLLLWNGVDWCESFFIDDMIEFTVMASIEYWIEIIKDFRW